MRECSSDDTEICELHDEKKRPSGSVSELQETTRYLRSPGFETRVTNQSKQVFGRRYFCIFNVSMSCPSKSVTVQKTERTTWPGSEHAETNYAVFYTDRNDKNFNNLYKNSSIPFSRTLDSDSFIAIMWSDINTGYFEFKASCNQEEGSGDEDTDLNLGVQQG